MHTHARTHARTRTHVHTHTDISARKHRHTHIRVINIRVLFLCFDCTEGRGVAAEERARTPPHPTPPFTPRLSHPYPTPTAPLHGDTPEGDPTASKVCVRVRVHVWMWMFTCMLRSSVRNFPSVFSCARTHTRIHRHTFTHTTRTHTQARQEPHARQVVCVTLAR